MVLHHLIAQPHIVIVKSPNSPLCKLPICPLKFLGFEKASTIQQRGIVPITKGLDVIQQAQIWNKR